MTDFNAIGALLGGMLIGAAALVLMLANGRILGVSGILGGLIGQPGSKDTSWRLAVVAGMATPAIVLGATGHLAIQGNGLGLPLLIIAGLLVGFGSRMGYGCTSGHGICGLARLSRRSMVAVATFMAVAAVTVFVMRHVVGG